MPTDIHRHIEQTKSALKKQLSQPQRTCTKKPKSTDVFDFAYELAALLKIGIPITNALELLISSCDKATMRIILETIKLDIESGASLNEAFKKHPRTFDSLFCHLAHIGEQSGTLAIQLNQAATYKEHANTLKNKIKKALTYPACVVLFSLFILAGILTFIIPQFQSLFDNFHAQLPLLTRCVINLSSLLKHKGWLFLLIFGGFASLLYSLNQCKPNVAYRIDQTLLRLPFVGQPMTNLLIARICHILAITYRAGLPIPNAIELLSHSTKNRVYAKALHSIYKQIKTGEALHLAFSSTKLFPTRMTQMIHIGEQSGSLDTMLEKIAGYYQTRLDTQIEQMNKLLEPAIIVFLGGAIGIVIVAMYLPIFRLGSLF